MTRVVPINLAYNPRTLWFSSGDLEISKDDPVLVLTARGTEFGYAAGEVFEASEEELAQLRSPLKPVKRIATEEDLQKVEELKERNREALEVFREMVTEGEEEMHPVSVEFLFDEDKAVFYFEAEDRVDFRDLVRRLASRFHVRIDMRQIGVRDEARIVGGIGNCGQELCCKRLGGEFCPVSIRMAKEQDLSLNPQKISGLCGRLMCCLRYEYEAYKDFKSRAPKLNAVVQTPAGEAKVIELDVPREYITLKIEDEKPVKVPLADFDPPENGERPHVVGEEAWEYATTEHTSTYRGDPLTYMTTQFTGKDKLADVTRVRRIPAGHTPDQSTEQDSPPASQSSKGRKPRARRSKVKHSEESVATEPRRQQRRRSIKLSTGEDGNLTPQAVPISEEEPSRSQKGVAGSPQKKGSSGKSSQKPRRQSRQRSQAKDQAKDSKARGSGKPSKTPTANNGQSTHRRSRRRSHTSGSDTTES